MKYLPLFRQLPLIQLLFLQILPLLLHQILLNLSVVQIQHFLVEQRFRTFSFYHLTRSYYFLPCSDRAHSVLSLVFRYLFKFIFQSLFLVVMKDLHPQQSPTDIRMDLVLQSQFQQMLDALSTLFFLLMIFWLAKTSGQQMTFVLIIFSIASGSFLSHSTSAK